MTDPTNQPADNEPEDAPAEAAAASAKAPANRMMGYAVLGAAVVLALAVGGYLLLSGGGSDNNPADPNSLDAGQVRQILGDPTPRPDTGVLEPQRPEVGKKAPDFALVDARDPSKVRKLSDYKGKSVLVNWYASWCGPCQREIPALEKLYTADSPDVVVLGVDFLEDYGAATSILDDLKATYPAVADTSGVVSQHYRVGEGGKGIPWTFFVDKDGILRGITIGELTASRMQDGLKSLGINYTP